MACFRLWSLLIPSLVFAIPSISRASNATLFILPGADDNWRSETGSKSTVPDIIIDQMLNRTDGRARILVTSSPSPAAAPRSLTAYAHFLKQTFAPDGGPDLLDVDATYLGHTGRELHFRLQQEHLFYCELFVFLEGRTRRGILCASSEESFDAPPYSLLSHLQPKSATASDAVILAPLHANADAVVDFPIGFRMIGNRENGRVIQLIVTTAPDRPGQWPKIQIGDEIIAIDGRRSTEYAAGMEKSSELGRIFLNRSFGDEVRLDLISARTRKTFSVTLRIE